MDPLPPDFNSSENITQQCLAFSGTFRAFAIVAVLLRFAARKSGGSRIWWDDWLMLLLGIIQIPNAAVDISAIKLGMGSHLGWILQQNQGNPDIVMSEYMRLQYVDGLSYAPDIALLKTSILCLYIRLFGIEKSFRRICYVQIAIIALWALIADLVFIFQCNPVAITWSITRNPANCWDVTKFWYSVSAINVVTDIGLLLTPLPTLLALKLSVEKWTYIATILALGLTEVALSILRTVKIGPLKFIDTTWDSAQVLIYSIIQGCVLTIVACLPIMAPLALWPLRWFERRSGTSRSLLSESTPRMKGSKRSRLESFGDDHELVATETNLQPMRVTRTTDITVTEERLRPGEALGSPWQGAWMFHGDNGIQAGHRP